MSNEPRFSPAELDHLEQKLWDLISSRSLLGDEAPPHLETLLPADEACELYAEALQLYAVDRALGETAHWHTHPLLDHLQSCAQCREALAELQAAATIGEEPPQRWRDEDLNITVFDRQFPDDEAGKRRTVLDPRRPLLISSDFLADPAGWHYSLEMIRRPGEEKPGLLLSLTAPDDAAIGDIPVKMVLFGQVLHGHTGERGQVYFPDVVIPADVELDTPLISLRLNLRPAVRV